MSAGMPQIMLQDTSYSKSSTVVIGSPIVLIQEQLNLLPTRVMVIIPIVCAPVMPVSVVPIVP